MSERLHAMQQQIDELGSLLTVANTKLGNLSQARDEGLLLVLEKKAARCDGLALELREANEKATALADELTEKKKSFPEMFDKNATLCKRTNELEKLVIELTGKIEPLEEMLRIFRLGKYEYYTIRVGDTCKSIAAQPMIYDDESKHMLIRQANRGHVADLDNLVVGEVLIIPRPEGSGAHEF